jgi:hypothetical protein
MAISSGDFFCGSGRTRKRQCTANGVYFAADENMKLHPAVTPVPGTSQWNDFRIKKTILSLQAVCQTVASMTNTRPIIILYIRRLNETMVWCRHGAILSWSEKRRVAYPRYWIFSSERDVTDNTSQDSALLIWRERVRFNVWLISLVTTHERQQSGSRLALILVCFATSVELARRLNTYVNPRPGCDQ